MKLGAFLLAWGEQSFIAADQFINAVLTPMVTWRVGFADETLSARTYRCARDGKLAAKILQPLINILFSWQKQDTEINAAAGKLVTKHCEMAFWKEKLRRNLPPAER